MKRLLFSIALILAPTFVHAATINQKELKCLADNIYYEAGGESYAGKIAVAFVTLNRVYSRHFDDTICDVVHAKKKVNGRYICQFSWVCDKPKRFERKVYDQSKKIALKVIRSYNNMTDITEGALFFHAVHVSPHWRKAYKRIVQIDKHIFYKPKTDRL